MYASLGNHLYHGLHFLFAFVLLLVLYPRWLFSKLSSDDGLEQAVGNFLRIVPLLVAIGYVLVVTKLFEWLALTTILILLVVTRAMRMKTPEERDETASRWTVWGFDYFEGLISLKKIGLRKYQEAKSKSKDRYRKLVSSVPRMLSIALFAFIILLSAYIRYYDALTSPVPGMSDGNVTLKFMKFIDMRQLFPDGFYPSGLYIILDTIFKYASINSIYVLKYMGPTCIMLVMGGIYFAVSRFTKNKYAGAASMIAYGLLSVLYAGNAYDRQAATNSQEFAFIFVFPALYFYLSYLHGGNKNRLWTAAAGTMAVGSAHMVGYAWLGMGMGLLILLHILVNGKQDFKRVVFVGATGVGASIAVGSPYVLSKLMRVKVHESTGNYLTSRLADIVSPDITIYDQIALTAALLVFIHGLVAWRDRYARFAYLFSSLFVLGTFAVYYYGGTLTKLEVVSVRSEDIWVLCLPFIVGMAWHSTMSMMGRSKGADWVQLGLSLSVAVASVAWVPVKPIIPYKMEWDAAVEQYLRIHSEFTPNSYLIVSPRVQEYAIVLGSGFHMYLGEGDGDPHLLGVYDPSKEPLTRFGENKHDDVAPEIFIFYEKNVFKQDLSALSTEKPNYDRYEQEYPQLLEWINEYREAHEGDGSFSVYYEDENFTVFHLHREESRDEIVDRIFG